MVISFPRTIPDELPLAGLSFQPDPMLELTPLRSGAQVAVEIGPTLWKAKFSSSELTPVRYGIVRAFCDTLLTSKEFYGYDKVREFPLNYRGGFAGLMVGSNPFTGDCTLDSVENDNLRVNLADLPVGFVLSAGDYLAFDYGSTGESRALHRIAQGAIAGGGGDATVEVRPYVRPGWQVGMGDPARTVMLYRAAAKMVIVPGTFSDDSSPPDIGKISFEAVQTL